MMTGADRKISASDQPEPNAGGASTRSARCFLADISPRVLSYISDVSSYALAQFTSSADTQDSGICGLTTREFCGRSSSTLTHQRCDERPPGFLADTRRP